MKFTAEQIAGILEGVVEGNPQVEVSKLSKMVTKLRFLGGVRGTSTWFLIR